MGKDLPRSAPSNLTTLFFMALFSSCSRPIVRELSISPSSSFSLCNNATRCFSAAVSDADARTDEDPASEVRNVDAGEVEDAEARASGARKLRSAGGTSSLSDVDGV